MGTILGGNIIGRRLRACVNKVHETMENDDN